MTQRPSGAVAPGVSTPRHHPSTSDPAPLPSRALRPSVPLAPPGRPRRRPTALGFIREDLSGPRLERHTALIISAAKALGYDMLHVVRIWPEMAPNLLQLIVDFARGLQVSALIVPDLAHVDHRPGPLCDHVDLITVNPPETWARAYEPADDTCQPAPDLAPLPLPESFLQPFLVPLPGGHTDPGGSIGRLAAHRIMQEHKGCRAVCCPRKAAALTELVDCGAMVPAMVSPAQRAARRGLTVDRAVDLPTLHATLTALRQL